MRKPDLAGLTHKSSATHLSILYNFQIKNATDLYVSVSKFTKYLVVLTNKFY